MTVLLILGTVQWAPREYICNSGMSDICNGIANNETVPMNSHSRPLKSIHANA